MLAKRSLKRQIPTPEKRLGRWSEESSVAEHIITEAIRINAINPNALRRAVTCLRFTLDKYPAATKYGDHNKNFESATLEIKIEEAGFLKKSPEFAGALAPCRLSRGRPLSGRRVQDTRLRLLGRPRYLPVPVRTSGAARAESAAL